MNTCPLTVSAALALVLFNALIWLTFGVIIAVDAHPALPDVPSVRVVMAALSFAAFAVLAGLYTALRRRSKLAYYLTVAALGVVSLLTIFDEFGLADLVVLILNVVPLIFLIKDRAWYLQKGLFAHVSL